MSLVPTTTTKRRRRMRRTFALLPVLLVFAAIACADTESEPRVVGFDMLATFVGDRGPVEFLAVGEDATLYARGDNLADAIAAHGGMQRLLGNAEWSHYVVALPKDEADKVNADIIAWLRSDGDSATTDDANRGVAVSPTEEAIQPRLRVVPRPVAKASLRKLRKMRGNVTLRIVLGVTVSRMRSDVAHNVDVLPCTDQSLFEDELEYHCLFILRRDKT